MLKLGEKSLALLLMLLCSACSSQIDQASLHDKGMKQAGTTATADLASLTNIATLPQTPISGTGTEILSSTQKQYPAGDLCAVLDGCKQTQPLLPVGASEEAQTNLPSESSRTGGAGTHNQTSIYPDMNVDLVQLPGEASIQYVNGIQTSLVKDKENAQLSQKAEFKNVRFNQIRSPSSMNTINMVMTDDKSVNGSLEQSFKFKSIEMIQRDSAGSIHAMNYLGDKSR